MHFLKSIEIRKLWWKHHLISERMHGICTGRNIIKFRTHHPWELLRCASEVQPDIHSEQCVTCGYLEHSSYTLIWRTCFILSEIFWLLQRENFKTSYIPSIFASVPYYLKSNWQMLWDNGLASSKDLSFVLV